MHRSQIENIFKTHGLSDYVLRNTNDLLKCLGIDLTTVEGYKDLDDDRRLLFVRFVLNFLNRIGMDSKITFFPTSIYNVVATTYYAKDEYGDEVSVQQIIAAIDRNGNKKTIHNYRPKKYKNLKIISQNSDNYFRIEYNFHGKNEWLHIIDEHHWY